MARNALIAGACLMVVGVAGLTAGVSIALVALILGAGLAGGVAPWVLLRPYLRDEAARERKAGRRENRGSVGFVPDLIERDTRARKSGERPRGLR